ncbi:hypothetical protein AgCh_020365 [Apium graveolens]
MVELVFKYSMVELVFKYSMEKLIHTYINEKLEGVITFGEKSRLGRSASSISQKAAVAALEIGYAGGEAVLTMVYIIDAKKFSDEPVPVITLPSRVPYGFHGTFMRKGAT